MGSRRVCAEDKPACAIVHQRAEPEHQRAIRHWRSEMKVCGLCGAQVQRLANSHIYPASMSKEQAAGGELVSVRPERGYVSIATAGLRDRIVCGQCEALFHPFDEEAINFRRRALKLDGLIGYRHESIQLPTLKADAGKLHTFAMQTLLRSALSGVTPEIERSSLTDWISKKLISRQSTIEDGPEVFVRVVLGDLGRISMNPLRHDGDGLSLYSLYMPNFIVSISASENGKLELPTRGLTLSPGMEVPVWRSKIRAHEYQFVADGLSSVAGKVEDVFQKIERSRRRKMPGIP